MTKPPQADELEVSVFGPGVGECIVLHLGDGQWAVVDSCRERETSRPVALRYLEDLGVDPASSVRQVIVTHWHDDHVAGVSELFAECSSAELVVSAALNRKEFYTVVAASRRKPEDDLGVHELSKLLDLVQQRRSGRVAARGPRWAMADQLLLRTQRAEVHALSPSSATFTLALRQFDLALPRVNESRRRLVSLDPNETAVVLWVRAGAASVLLGSDLEQGSHPAIGWGAIVASATRPPGTAQMYKVAHHGSPNADHEEIWSRLLEASPFAVVTPYSAGKVPRPADEDLHRIAARTGRVFVTAKGGKRDKTRESLERFAAVKKHNLRDFRGKMGQVRLRCRPNNDWRVETIGAAYQYSAAS